MANRLGMDKSLAITNLLNAGFSERRIAVTLEVFRGAVRRHLAAEKANSTKARTGVALAGHGEASAPAAETKSASTCEPFRDRILEKLELALHAKHTLRYHAHHQTRGFGHLYQGPFKSFPVQDDSHFLTVCRYVERNALRAKMVKRAENWEFGSLYRWHHKHDRDPAVLSSWPIRRPPGWTARVNEALSQRELETIQTCTSRGRPYGCDEWIEETCERAGTWSSIRPRGRPRNKPKAPAVQPPPK